MARQCDDASVSVLPRFADSAFAAVRLPLRNGHLAYLDGWRGLCILLVIVGHFVHGLGPLANAGVEFFFVLSGRLMAEILVFQRQNIGHFLRRRVARVGPAIAVYVLLIGGAFNAALWAGGHPLRLASPAAALFFFHNYLLHDSAVSIFEHTWSLAVEEHSYLLLALIVLLTRRRPWLCAAIALTICALAIVNTVRIFGLPYDGGQFIYWRSDVRVASVLLSFTLCIVMRETKWQVPAWTPWVTALAALPAAFIEGEIGPWWAVLCTPPAALAVNSLEQSSEAFRTRLAAPALLWFGTVSFSIYVWQQLFFAFHEAGAPALLCLPLTLVCAMMSFRLVEEPARNVLNRCWTGQTPRMESAA